MTRLATVLFPLKLCLIVACAATFSAGQELTRNDRDASRTRTTRQTIWSSTQDATSEGATTNWFHGNKCNETSDGRLCGQRGEGRANGRLSRRPLVRGAGEPQVRRLNETETRVEPDGLATNATTTTARPQQSSLITRTSDAIYRALTGYFSHDDEIDRIKIKPNVSSKSTTPMPRQQTSSTTLKPAGRNGTSPQPPLSTSTSQRPATATTTTTTQAPKIKTTTTTTRKPPTTTTTTTSSSTTTNVPKSKNKPKSTASPTTTSSTTTTTSLPPLITTPGSREVETPITTLSSDETATSTTTATPTTTAASTRTTSTTTTSTTTSTTRRPETTTTKPTMQPHLDLNWYKDEPHSTTTTSSTTQTPTTPRQRARTSTTRRPQLDTTSTTTTTTTKPTTNDKSAIKLIEDAEREKSNSSSSSPSSEKIKAHEESAPAPSDQENSLEFFSFLNRAFNSVYSVNELTYLNRTTRLVHESEGAESSGSGGGATASLLPATTDSDFSFTGEREGEGDVFSSSSTAVTSQKLQQQQQQQVTTREDILLLCKLLHKHLENGSIIAANGAFLTPNGTNLLGAPASNQKQQRMTTTSTTSTTTTAAPRNLLQEFVTSGLSISDPQNELNESLTSHLLESIFTLERRAANELAYEEAGQRLLTDLFNAGFRNKFAAELNPTGSADVATQVAALAPLQLKPWSRTVTGGRSSSGGGRMKMVYWLVMPAAGPISSSSTSGSSLSTPSSAGKFKVLNSEEANELLDQLEHSFVQQAIDDALLVRPLVLVAAHQKSRSSSQTTATSTPSADPDDDLLKAVSPPSAHVADDKLGESKSSWGLPSFFERLFNAPFQENLQLYLILLLVLLFLVIMCVALPLICCKSCGFPRRRSESSAALAGTFVAPGNRQANLASQPLGVEQLTTTNGKRGRARQGTGAGSARATRRKQQAAAVKQQAREPTVSSVSGELPAYTRNLNENDDGDEEIAYYKDDYGLARRTSGTINEAVWTKLSNSTTTLTKDRTRVMYDEGQRDMPIARQRDTNSGGEGPSGEQTKRFEWYTFEDKTTTQLRRNYEHERAAAERRDQQSQTLTDHLKMTKSVQTFGGEEGARQPEDDERQLNMTFSDRMETHNSDTLTKSELVMLKEKLIPIGARQQAAEADQVRDLRPRQPERDYVNQPTRHIDSSIDDSTNGMSRSLVNAVPLHSVLQAPPPPPPSSSAAATQAASSLEDQRTPKMRYLELPGKTQSKVEAIRDELGRIEARDGTTRGAGTRPAVSRRDESSSSSYKRYDVV